MKLPVGKWTTLGFVLAALALVASGWMTYSSRQRISGNEAWVAHTHNVLDALSETSSNLVDAEDAQRGYAITAQAIFAGKYQAAATGSHRKVEQLRELCADNPIQLRRIDELEQTIARRLSYLDEGIQARDEQGLEAAREIVVQGKGTREMESVHGIISEMRTTELELLRVREAESQSSYRAAIITILATSLIGLALVVTAFALAARESGTRQRAAEELARHNDELEGRVEARTSELAATNESLVRSNRELEQFASVASHDLQEPLRKIQAFGDRLQSKCAEGLGEQGRDYLLRMQGSATRMRNLIDALLMFSRVTTKAQPFVPVDLASIAQEVLSDLEDRLDKSGGRVEVGAMPTVEADALQMRQLFQNLISNALKFARKSEPPVVRLESKMLNGSDGDASCEISVSDNGIGFEQVYVDRIFELFQRLHARHEYEGTGLGLAICRKIVQRHGGRIDATSEPEKGSTFLITLPLQQDKKEILNG